MKQCPRCNENKEDIEFGHRGLIRTDLKSYCRSCSREESRLTNEAIKLEALNHYGRVCFCCKESEPMFLSLDHTNSDGGGRTREHSGSNFYKWLKRNNWPSLSLQVACHNCNLGRHINGGICPHQNKFLCLGSSER